MHSSRAGSSRSGGRRGESIAQEMPHERPRAAFGQGVDPRSTAYFALPACPRVHKGSGAELKHDQDRGGELRGAAAA